MRYMEQHGSSFKIRFVNRLDMNTSGLLMIAKNSHCQDSMMKQMKLDKVEKTYLAILHGVIPEERGTIDQPIGRPDPDDMRRRVMEDGYPSVTHYEVLERFEFPGRRAADTRWSNFGWRRAGRIRSGTYDVRRSSAHRRHSVRQ